MARSPLSLTSLACAAVVSACSSPAARVASAPAAVGRIDHVMIGAADLDRAVANFERDTGVRPVYGGVHPTGTHNALVSLGGGAYLELIALQPGKQGPQHFAVLASLVQTAPIGWAVSAAQHETLRARLRDAGFSPTESQEGSRVAPSGARLQWKTFGLHEDLAGAPFFITWASDTPHPSSTSPTGCTLNRLEVAGPDTDRLGRLARLVDGPVVVTVSPEERITVWLDCPKGRVVLAAASR